MKLPKEIKESAISINFTDGTSRMFACDSGEKYFSMLEIFCLTCMFINQSDVDKEKCMYASFNFVQGIFVLCFQILMLHSGSCC